MADKNKYALGIDLGGTSVKLGIVSNLGAILSKISIPSNAELGPDHVISQIIKGIKQIRASNKTKIKGIGIRGKIHLTREEIIRILKNDLELLNVTDYSKEEKEGINHYINKLIKRIETIKY